MTESQLQTANALAKRVQKLRSLQSDVTLMGEGRPCQSDPLAQNSQHELLEFLVGQGQVGGRFRVSGEVAAQCIALLKADLAKQVIEAEQAFQDL